MAEYIEREALIEDLDKAAKHGGMGAIIAQTLQRYVQRVPAADVAPVVHGRWGDNGIPDSMLCGCSVCGFTCGAHSFLYCPMCGAKMDGGAE